MSLSIHSSSSAVGYNEDLITIIFLRLSAKSVLKCRCVCKYWQSIASDPQFCHQHASLRGPNPSPSGFLFKRNIDISSDFEFCSLTGNNNTTTTTAAARIVSFDYLKPSRNVNGNISLRSSCNGLLLFQSSNSSDSHTYYVCNPTTKKFITLPHPNYFKFVCGHANLAFDPCVSPHYKVVFLWKGSKRTFCFAVYSSETKTWLKLRTWFASNSVKDLEVIEGSGIYCNGKIHWLVTDMHKFLYYDIEKDWLTMTKLPRLSSLSLQPYVCFEASCDRLHVVLCGFYNTYVFEMKEDYSAWVVKYNTGFPNDYRMLRYFCKEQDEALLQVDYSWNVTAYNLKEKSTIKVCELKPLSSERDIYLSYCLSYDAYQLIESLSCV